jgi:acetyl-CoA acyltransferase
MKEEAMNDVVIVEAVRSPVGRRNGGLSGTHPADLGAQVLQGLAERGGIDPVMIDDVIWGCVSQAGDQTGNIGRSTVLAAGWPEDVPGVTIDRQCGSSQQAIAFAAAGLVAGYYDVVVAGGTESMSRTPLGSAAAGGDPVSPLLLRRYGVHPNQGIGAEMIADKWGLTRTMLDEYSLRSHERAAAAQDSGAFAEQIQPISTGQGVVVTDEGVRRSTTSEALKGLKTVFSEDGVITAGNSSQISDGSAALLMTTTQTARKLGLAPLVRVLTNVVAANDPVMMLTAPIPATEKALCRSGLKITDIGSFEVNEAFAPIPLAWQSEFRVDDALLNPLGGAIALGHPLGGSGARLATTLIHHMRDNGIRYGLQTMCEGGGQANATIFELL